MKKIALSLLFAFSFCCLSTISAQAANLEIASETVSVISYDLTKNNHVLEQKTASGTIISANGLVLTNKHVVTDPNDELYENFAICIVSDTNKKPDCLYTASVLATDKSLDTALLRIDPTDIYGKPVPSFPHLSYENKSLPETGESIELVGFPGIGGKTLTFTKGQVSGYDDKENINLIKTDAAISPGNSGGTAKDGEGNFVGVPSYLKSLFGTIGYIVPLAEITPWIKENLNSTAKENPLAKSLLDDLLRLKYETEQNKKFKSPLFPFYSVSIPQPWEVEFINDTNLVVKNTIKGKTVYIQIQSEHFPFEITDGLMQHFIKKIEKSQHEYTNYQRKPHDHHGLSGYLISYDAGPRRTYFFLGAKENVLFTYQYAAYLDIEESQGKAEDFLSNFQFLDEANDAVVRAQTHQQTYPNISLKTFDEFFINSTINSKFKDLIVTIENPDHYDQDFQINHENLDKDYYELTPAQIMKEELRDNPFQLINQYENIVIDGLPGYAYTYTYRGDDFSKIHKETVAVVIADKKLFRFAYSDLVENYDKNISTVVKILNNFQYYGEENAATKNTYKIPSFVAFYQDIKDHLYEEEISALASKDIIKFGGSNFYPEEKISRMQALRVILDSKIFVEEGRNLSDTRDGITKTEAEKVFRGLSEKEARILNYAEQKGIISNGKDFRSDSNINLAEALKILCETYELSVWDPPYREKIVWYLPYVYKGRLLRVIPRDMKPGTVLSRGQFASIIYDFVRVVGERDDL